MNISQKILQVINEANLEQSKAMGAWLKDIDIHRYNAFLDNFKYASQVLKKYTIVNWYLKCALIFIILGQLNHCNNEGKVIKLLCKKLNRYLRDFGVSEEYVYDETEYRDANYYLGHSLAYIRENMEHFLSFGYTEIESYNYPGKLPKQVFEDLQDIVDKKFNLDEEFTFTDEQEREACEFDVNDYLVFDDGWKWVWKDSNDCRFESEKGGKGHCGASMADDYLLSLREPVEDSRYKIWATFSIDRDGYLGQRKGVHEFRRDSGKVRERLANLKPQEHLYPYIYELLIYGKSKGDIKGFKNSGYRSEIDISLEDLSDDLSDEQIKTLKNLGGFEEGSAEDFEKQYGDIFKFFSNGESIEEYVASFVPDLHYVDIGTPLEFSKEGKIVNWGELSEKQQEYVSNRVFEMCEDIFFVGASYFEYMEERGLIKGLWDQVEIVRHFAWILIEHMST